MTDKHSGQVYQPASIHNADGEHLKILVYAGGNLGPAVVKQSTKRKNQFRCSNPWPVEEIVRGEYESQQRDLYEPIVVPYEFCV